MNNENTYNPFGLLGIIKNYFNFLVDKQTSHDLRNRFEKSAILSDVFLCFFYAVGAAIIITIVFAIALFEGLKHDEIIQVLFRILLIIASLYGAIFVVANVYVTPNKRLAEMLLKDLELQDNISNLEVEHETLKENLANTQEELKDTERSLKMWTDDCYMHENNHTKALKEIKKLEKEVELAETRLREAKSNVGKLQASSEELNRKHRRDISKRDTENRRLHREKEQMLHTSLDGFGIDNILEFLNVKLSNEFKEKLSERDVGILYGLLQEHVPDKTRMKEISIVPHEMLRARQIEQIVERYSQKITEVEGSDLSQTEKRDKINAYRLARERELGIEE